MSHSSINLDVANRIPLQPIAQVAQDKLGLDPSQIDLFGRYKAKIPLPSLPPFPGKPKSKLILITAMTPTTAGEGKTTTLIGLVDGLNRLGHKAVAALREPSVGPCFGMKGGGCGGGYAQVVPMTDINLHFTGDFHAVTSTHNLLTALVDNHLYWGHEPRIDPRRVTWGRVLDVNDRSLRFVVTGLGKTNGFTRESRFDITAASEIMAILCLATDLHDLQHRLGNIKVGRTATKEMVFAKELKAEGAMTVLLKEALNPNLVQTLEHNPALVHGGPFGNIAHGCSSVVATKAALTLADYVVTEGGFGADLGAEKFFDIKCRRSGLTPACAVVVGTIKALKLHGGAKETDLEQENLNALRQGLPNLLRHVEIVKRFGVPAVVAINQFTSDTRRELELVEKACADHGVKCALATHWANGGAGALSLAETVREVIEKESADFRMLYPDTMPLAEKVRTIAKEIYRAEDVEIPRGVQLLFTELERNGHGHFPVCMAKTQYSFSADPTRKGVPIGFTLPVREVRLAMGAGFVVVIAGDMMTMPGLPRIPAAESIGVDAKGNIVGLF
jgi:formate--tetrahydrofolate ligase